MTARRAIVTSLAGFLLVNDGRAQTARSGEIVVMRHQSDGALTVVGRLPTA